MFAQYTPNAELAAYWFDIAKERASAGQEGAVRLCALEESARGLSAAAQWCRRESAVNALHVALCYRDGRWPR